MLVAVKKGFWAWKRWRFLIFRRAKMQRKKQLCKFFQQGNCHFGARCKYVHEIEQQPSKASNNPFGFGTQAGTNPQSQPQQNPFGFGTQAGTNIQSQPQRNPFGFGSQSGVSSQQRHAGATQQQQQPNPFGFGVKSNNQPSKPFENKWTRSSGTPGTSVSASSRQPESQAQAVPHLCNPDACKKLIAEDFENERPLWKLTCYGHYKHLPCDIVGDVSYEELRMSAYADAKSGMSLQTIVEKERHLLNAKLVEFENLLRSPYKGTSSSAPTQSSSPQAPPNVFSQAKTSVASPSTWTFGQPAPPLNAASGFGTVAPSNIIFKQGNFFQNTNQNSSTSGISNALFGGIGSHSAQTSESSFVFSKPSFPNSFLNPTPTATPLQTSTPTISSQSLVTTGPNPALHEALQAVDSTSFINNSEVEDVPVDEKIWMKEKWRRGEIPETPPPERFVYRIATNAEL